MRVTTAQLGRLFDDAMKSAVRNVSKRTGKVSGHRLTADVREILDIPKNGSRDLADIREDIAYNRRYMNKTAGSDGIFQYTETADLDSSRLHLLDILTDSSESQLPKLDKTTKREISRTANKMFRELEQSLVMDSNEYGYPIKQPKSVPAEQRQLFALITDHYRELYGHKARSDYMPKHLLDQPFRWAQRDLDEVRHNLYPSEDNPRGSAEAVEQMSITNKGNDRHWRFAQAKINRLVFERLTADEGK